LVQYKENECVEDPHQSRVDLYRKTRCYLRNQRRKIKVVRTCGKNARRKNCEEGVKKYPRRKKVCWKATEMMLHNVENDLKKMGVKRGWRKIATD
jgi:hypothetical protein